MCCTTNALRSPERSARPFWASAAPAGPSPLAAQVREVGVGGDSLPDRDHEPRSPVRPGVVRKVDDVVAGRKAEMEVAADWDVLAGNGVGWEHHLSPRRPCIATRMAPRRATTVPPTYLGFATPSASQASMRPTTVPSPAAPAGPGWPACAPHPAAARANATDRAKRLSRLTRRDHSGAPVACPPVRGRPLGLRG